MFSPFSLKIDVVAVGKEVNDGGGHVFENRKDVLVGSLDGDIRETCHPRHVENEPHHCHVCGKLPECVSLGP